MGDNVMTVMGQVAASEKNSWHDKCPKGSESWCKYQLDKVNRTKVYIPAKCPDTGNIKNIKLIFRDFCKDEFLKKCLDCKIQNKNQSFNDTVWNRLQKNNLCWVSSFFIRSL